jgi:hypothetical protein
MAQQSHLRYVAQDNFSDPWARGEPGTDRPPVGIALRSHDRTSPEYQTDFHAAAAHDRRHEDPQHVAEQPEDLHLRGRELRRVPWQVSRQARRRARAGIVALTASDINSERMVIEVRQGNPRCLHTVRRPVLRRTCGLAGLWKERQAVDVTATVAHQIAQMTPEQPAAGHHSGRGIARVVDAGD